MQMIKPLAERIAETDPLKKIELAGRTCYKSEEKITDDSAEKFVRGIINRKHHAMIEHQDFAFELLCSPDTDGWEELANYIQCLNSPGFGDRAGALNYLHTTWIELQDEEGDVIGERVIVSGNVRALNECDGIFGSTPIMRTLYAKYPMLVYNEYFHEMYENGQHEWEGIEAKLINIDEIEDITYEEILAHKYLTFRFTTDRGVTHEFVRMRPASFAQESTRYVNYLEGLNICCPSDWYDKDPEARFIYEQAWLAAQEAYAKLIQMGQSPQQARAVLPQGTKAELVVSANMNEWVHIFNLRYFGTAGAPHPDIREVVGQAYAIAMNDRTVVLLYNMMAAEC